MDFFPVLVFCLAWNRAVALIETSSSEIWSNYSVFQFNHGHLQVIVNTFLNSLLCISV